MGCEGFVNKLRRWHFGNPDIAAHHLAEFVLDHWPAGLTIDSSNILATRLVLRKETSKPKVHAEALILWLNIIRIKSILCGRHLLESGLNASGSLIQDGAKGIIFKFWDSITAFVSLDSDGQEKVAQMLMPQFAFGFGPDGMHRCVLKDKFAVWKFWSHGGGFCNSSPGVCRCSSLWW